MAKRTCDCGTCRKCKHREYMNEWYRRPGNASVVRERARRYREENIEAVREYDRSRGHRNPPEQTKAHNATRVLERQPCEVCGARPAEAHHDDYSRPLEVRWLCKRHHAEHHRIVS